MDKCIVSKYFNDNVVRAWDSGLTPTAYRIGAELGNFDAWDRSEDVTVEHLRENKH